MKSPHFADAKQNADIDRTRSELYRDSVRVPFASELSLRARRAIYRRFIEVMYPEHTASVLDIGVTCDSRSPESNFFEQFYPYKDHLTCVGTEDGSHLERDYPGMRFIPVTPGEPLPFPLGYFDVAFSNAVVEHCGDREQQQLFISEALRVSKRFFIATPNRWFPFEVHTGIPLLHYLPVRVFRALLAQTRYGCWADERRLNILTARLFSRLFPAGTHVKVEHIGVGCGLFTSNIVAYGHCAGLRG